MGGRGASANGSRGASAKAGKKSGGGVVKESLQVTVKNTTTGRLQAVD